MTAPKKREFCGDNYRIPKNFVAVPCAIDFYRRLNSRQEYLEMCRSLEANWLVRPTGPLKINIELTSRCNFRCTECPQPNMRRAKQDMPFALAAKCIDQHAENFGYYVDLFAWGEPLMYRDLCDVIRYAVAAGTPMVHLNTNGGLMTPGMARDLVDSGIHGVNISALPSAGMAWELAARNLRAARDAAHSETPFIQIQATERPEITLPCAQAAGADALLSRKMLDLGRGAGIPDSGARPQCAQLWRNLVILADGSVTPCCGDAECVLRVGDMAHATLREIWNGTAMSDLRRAELEGKPVSLCVRCPDRDRR